MIQRFQIWSSLQNFCTFDEELRRGIALLEDQYKLISHFFLYLIIELLQSTFLTITQSLSFLQRKRKTKYTRVLAEKVFHGLVVKDSQKNHANILLQSLFFRFLLKIWRLLSLTVINLLQYQVRIILNRKSYCVSKNTNTWFGIAPMKQYCYFQKIRKCLSVETLPYQT